MGWDDVGGGADSDYVKLENGKAVRIHLLGDPSMRLEHFPPGAKTSTACVGKGKCASCLAGEKQIRKYSVEVYNFDLKRTQILEKGRSIFIPFKEAREVYSGDISKLDFVIKASGEGLERTYSVVPVPTIFDPKMVQDQPVIAGMTAKPKKATPEIVDEEPPADLDVPDVPF